MSEIKLIKKEIAKGKLKEAIDLFLELTEEKFPDVHFELIAISLRYNEIIQKERNNTVDFDKVQIEKSKITSSLIELLRLTMSQEKDASSQTTPFPLIQAKQNIQIGTMQGGEIVFQENEERNAMSSSKKKILFLSANPKNSKRLRIDEEVRKIEEGLERAKLRDYFELITKWAVQVDDLQRHFLDVSPKIVHFSGHGTTKGLIFEDVTGAAKLVVPEALSDLFALFSDTINCVVLNACYSEVQANAIIQHVDYVIGMETAIPDQAAIAFAVSFYDALGAGREVEFAYKLGCNRIKLLGLPGSMIPKLKQKEGDS